MSIIVRSSLPSAGAIDVLRDVVRLEDPEQALGLVTSIDALVADAASYRRSNGTVLTLFGVAAILLTASGILAVVVIAVTSRAREFAIRIALGARGSQIVRLVLRDTSAGVAIGAIAGLVTAYNLSFLLTRRALLFGVSPFEPWTYGGVAVAVVALGLSAAWVPARRAASQDPVTALNAE